MGGGNAPPPPTPIIVGAFLMTFAAGLLDASTYLCLHSTSTHMSGKVLKIGITAGDLDSDIHVYALIVGAFLLGSAISGACTATPARKTPKTAAMITLTVGALCCVVGLMLGAHLTSAIYVAALTAGLQNGLTTTVTGFMRTTHFTGTVTDVGLLLGQTYPLNAKNKAHFWKLKILAGLCATWVAAGLAGGLLHRHLGYRMAFVPGAIGLACGAYGLEFLRREARIAAAKEAEAAAAAKEAEATAAAAAAAAAKANPFAPKPKGGSGGAAALRRVTKTQVRLMSHGLAALQEMAKDMDGNLESMPSPAMKAYHLAYNVKRAESKFLKKLSSRRIAPVSDQDVDDSAVAAANARLGKICEFLLARPDTLAALEAEHGAPATGGAAGAAAAAGGSGTGFADFLASFAVVQQAGGTAVALDKAAAAAREPPADGAAATAAQPAWGKATAADDARSLPGWPSMDAGATPPAADHEA